MISRAILALKKRNGASQPAILKEMAEQFAGLPDNFPTFARQAFRKGVDSGHFEKIKASYKLSDAGKETTLKGLKAAKKAAAPKKKVVKKPAKKPAAKKAKKPAKKATAVKGGVKKASAKK